MERTGNTIGAEGRRQHNENDPQNGDKHHMQERLAEKEIQEGLDELAEGDDLEDGQGRSTESLETSPQADGVPDEQGVTDPEGVKPSTQDRLEEENPRE